MNKTGKCIKCGKPVEIGTRVWVRCPHCKTMQIWSAAKVSVKDRKVVIE